MRHTINAPSSAIFPSISKLGGTPTNQVKNIFITSSNYYAIMPLKARRRAIKIVFSEVLPVTGHVSMTYGAMHFAGAHALH